MGWGDSVAQWSLALPEAATITRALTAGLGQVLLGIGLVLGLA